MTRFLVLMSPMLLATGVAWAATGGSVVGSKHDFSRLGSGAFRASTEEQVCIFCHAAHGNAEKMDNRPKPPKPRASFRAAPAARAAGAIRAPTGASRICLSCHDGTVAVGDTAKKHIAVTGPGGDRIVAGRRSNLGTDPRTSHPISAPVTQGPGIHLPGPSDHVKLDVANVMQCTSCHDPHASADSRGKFLVKEGPGTDLCLSCHSESLGQATHSSHVDSPASFGPAQGNDSGFASVREAGCLACHAAHGADARGRLLRRGSAEGDDVLCLRCHGGTVARANVARDAAKASSHSVDGGGVHDPAEGPGGSPPLPEIFGAAPRHAVCVDCHDPHAASGQPAVAPAASARLAGVWGIDLAGQRVSPVRYEYEVCLKCHGDSANKPQDRLGQRLGTRPIRAIPDANLREVFGPSAISYHPVAAPGRGADVPSLVPPWTIGSYVYCGDCHASDSGASPGGVRGPHGSVYPFILERNYTTTDNSAESSAAYALCYKCHDRDRLLSGADSPFVSKTGKKLHAVHVVQQRAPCSVCHASHGVSSRSGSPNGNAHLIDFDVSVVQPNAVGARSYVSLGLRSGSCSLRCHQQTHADASYSP